MLHRDGNATTVVFSHPNHELAIFGIVQSLRPTLVYLTDGGGERRVAQTRRGLESIGLADRAYFLDYGEQSFYDALLDRDAAFYAEVASRVRELLRDLRPTQVLCDAVEFYNPVHDMSLPIVRAALAHEPDVAVFEVPLVHQKPAGDERYEFQRTSPSRRPDQIEWPLSEAELATKLGARDRIYTALTAQMGPLLAAIPLADLALEVVAPAPASLPEPDGERVVRYEWRARLLLERGEIERGITYADHYLPVATSLL
jgi:hypothetical protein